MKTPSPPYPTSPYPTSPNPISPKPLRARKRAKLLSLLTVAVAIGTAALWGGGPSSPFAAAQAQEALQTPGKTGAQRAALPQDPFDLTDEDIDLLQALSARREALDRREQAIDQRAALLKAAEARLERKITAFEALRREIEDLVERHSAESQERIAGLVKIYVTMKPKDAARIFSEMETPVLLQVVGAMPERSAAAILAEMDPQQAKSITVALAEIDALPLSRE